MHLPSHTVVFNLLLKLNKSILTQIRTILNVQMNEKLLSYLLKKYTNLTLVHDDNKLINLTVE